MLQLKINDVSVNQLSRPFVMSQTADFMMSTAYLSRDIQKAHLKNTLFNNSLNKNKCIVA